MYESAMMTGTHPACSTSLRVAWPSRAPRNTTQNDDSYGNDNSKERLRVKTRASVTTWRDTVKTGGANTFNLGGHGTDLRLTLGFYMDHG